MRNINFISSWAQGIIVCIIIATIIEMILPKGNNSKYVKMVVGVFVLFTIITPMINKITGNKNNKINLNDYIQTSTNETIKTSAGLNNEDLIKQMYEENLKVDIKSKLSQKGYVIGNIDVEILNNDEYTLNKINVQIVSKCQSDESTSNVTTIVENIENIVVNIGGKNENENDNKQSSIIAENERRKIVEYLSGVYEVKEANIIVQ